MGVEEPEKYLLDGRKVAEARDRWLESDEGQCCLADGRHIRGAYLRNRIELAFLAGVEAAVGIIRPPGLAGVMPAPFFQLKAMLADPRGWNHNPVDTDAIRWAVELIESLDRERELMRRERAEMARYRAAVAQGLAELATIDPRLMPEAAESVERKAGANGARS